MKRNLRFSSRNNWVTALSIGCCSAFATAPQFAHAETNSVAVQATASVDQELRLETIGYRLRRSNAAHCETPEILTGMMLHDLGSYSAKTRSALGDQLGLTYGFGIQKFVPGSAADHAGLLPRDEIIGINGQDLKDFATDAISRKATYNRIERFVDHLATALRQGPATLRIRREGSERDVILTGELGCGGGMVMIESSQLNAWSDGKNTAVTTRMMQLAGSDDELAFVVSHEMAHNILHHARKLEQKSSLLAEFGIGSRKVKQAEVEADTLAMNLLASAAYDLDAPERFLRRAAPLQFFNLAISHPSVSRRIDMARNERDRIRSTVDAQLGLDTLTLARRNVQDNAPSNSLVRFTFDTMRLIVSSPDATKAAAIDDLGNLAIASSTAPQKPPLAASTLAPRGNFAFHAKKHAPPTLQIANMQSDLALPTQQLL